MPTHFVGKLILLKVNKVLGCVPGIVLGAGDHNTVIKIEPSPLEAFYLVWKTDKK